MTQTSPPAASGGAAADVPAAGRAAGRRFARNALALGIARFSEIALAFVFIRILNSELGAVVMGKYYAIIALIFTVIIIPEMGMDQALVRLTSRNPQNAPTYLGVAIVVRNFLAVIAVGVIVATAYLGHYDAEMRTAILVGCAWILSDLMLSTNYAVYLAFEKTHFETILTLLLNILIIPCTLYALHHGWGLVGVFIATGAANVVTAICGWILTTKYFVKPVFKWVPALWKEMLELCFTIGFTRGTRMIYGRIDTLLLQRLTPGGPAVAFTVIAIYNTAYNLVRKAVPLQSILARPLLPIASRAVDQPDLLKMLHKKAFKMLLLASVPACAMIFGASHLLVKILTGGRFEQFAPAVPLLAFLSVLLLTSFASSSIRVVMVALNMQKFLLSQGLVMIGINFVLDLVLIPYFGAQGRAWWGPAVASLLAELYLTGVLLVVVSRRVGAFPDLGDCVKIVAGGGLMVGVMWAMSQVVSGRIGVLAGLALAPAVFAAFIVGTKAVRREEIAFFRRGGGRGPGAGGGPGRGMGGARRAAMMQGGVQ